jgi:hypothetical protein
MTPEERKEAFRIFWLVKGHLNVTEQCVMECYNSYFKRVWYNEETYYKIDGFEEAYEEFHNHTT